MPYAIAVVSFELTDGDRKWESIMGRLWGMVRDTFSKEIKELRTTLGLTQEQFAAKLGITFTTVNRWENNKAKPSPLALQKIKELQNEPKHNERSK